MKDKGAAVRPMKLAKIVQQCRIDKPKHFKLADYDPAERFGLSTDIADVKPILAEGVVRMEELQERLFADGQWGVLIVLQGMDAAGKDGVVKHVMSGVNPQGCEVHAFKAPSAEELGHDFLWRVAKVAPARGRIGIFNRSHYEEVLVVRVHPELLQKENLPPGETGKTIWQHRFKDIRAFEHHLARNGTVVLKFHLRISRDEQRKRFLSRLDEPDKRWKFSASDAAERAYWDDYMAAYEEMIRETSTDYAPWYVVPADHKHVAWLVVSAAIIEALDGLKLRYPKVTGKALKDQKKAERKLHAEKPAGGGAGKTSKQR
jgi:PPK2 family polyphosphate:nucleotide phosphotransferase